MLYKDFLKQLDGCPFCAGHNKILREQGGCYLTYALAPYHKHHLLIVPRAHRASLQELTTEEKESVAALQEVGLQSLKKLGYTSITLLVREGESGNKSIEHVHFHIVPKIKIGDIDHYGAERRILEEDEIDTLMREVFSVMPRATESTRE